MRFRDRRDAGRRLGAHLAELEHLGLRDGDTIVLGLPRGGVPVAYEVAKALGAPLDVLVVRKLGVPVQPELAMGAVGEGGAMVVNPAVLRLAGVREDQLHVVEARERAEVEARARRFRGDRPPASLTGRTAVIVDDGLATGATARAALAVAKARGAARTILAVPVGPPEAAEELGDAADAVVCLSTPARFDAVGSWYQDFRQTSDDEVIRLLRQAGDGDSAEA